MMSMRLASMNTPSPMAHKPSARSGIRLSENTFVQLHSSTMKNMEMLYNVFLPATLERNPMTHGAVQYLNNDWFSKMMDETKGYKPFISPVVKAFKQNTEGPQASIAMPKLPFPKRATSDKQNQGATIQDLKAGFSKTYRALFSSLSKLSDDCSLECLPNHYWQADPIPHMLKLNITALSSDGISQKTLNNQPLQAKGPVEKESRDNFVLRSPHGDLSFSLDYRQYAGQILDDYAKDPISNATQLFGKLPRRIAEHDSSRQYWLREKARNQLGL
jgi:hypothetical protein